MTGTTVNLSLISHTNAGKTTLARTLLGEDVGEVRDAAHVTDEATGYVLLQAGDDVLMLWDTPGFGDTARLLKRLRLAGNPVGWFLTQVWDRWRERPLWSSQQAVRNARDQADVILYLVNAAEDPADAGYVGLEMEVLSWIGKPVLLLLNQMGPPHPGGGAEEQRWLAHLDHVGVVKGALPLDAFVRCWVQERALLDAVAPLLDPAKATAMPALTARWQTINLDRFDRAMRLLATPLAEAAADRAPVRDKGLRDKIGNLLRGGKGDSAEARRAMTGLGERLEQQVRSSTEAVIHVYGLSGKATRQVLERVQRNYAEIAPAKEGYAAMLGGLMSGAVGGLAADLAAGGLTLGGGMIVGGILGAMGAGGLARGYNMARGDQGAAAVSWSEDFLVSLTGAAMLRYLAVAHFGRGRGDFEEGEAPAFWQDAVNAELAQRRDTIIALCKRAWREGAPAVTEGFTAVLTEATRALLIRLYPKAQAVLAAPSPRPLPDAIAHTPG